MPNVASLSPPSQCRNVQGWAGQLSTGSSHFLWARLGAGDNWGLAEGVGDITEWRTVYKAALCLKGNPRPYSSLPAALLFPYPRPHALSKENKIHFLW